MQGGIKLLQPKTSQEQKLEDNMQLCSKEHIQMCDKINNLEEKYCRLNEQYENLNCKYQELYNEYIKIKEERFIENEGVKKKKNNSKNGSEQASRRPNAIKQIGSTLFFGMVIAAILALLIYPQNGIGKNIMGYSYYNVLSASMQSELPMGSFVLTKSVSVESIEEGDNITFLKDSTTIATHKVIEIIENYDNSGSVGFRTKGTENPKPDEDIVYASNVIGKVVFSIPVLGYILSYIAKNIWLLFLFWGLISIIISSLRIVLKKEQKEKTKKLEE
jgi:signal peptidase I, archaeal type